MRASDVAGHGDSENGEAEMTADTIESSRRRGAVRRLLVGSGVLAGVVALGAAFGTSIADAAPSNARNALSGTFDCANGESGTFVVNSGNAQAETTWNVAHLTFSSGGTGIFVPTMLDLTITFDGQTFTSQSTKGSAPSAVSCTISAAQDGFTLSGVVAGKIVHNG
jgi:hypothetical protein